MVEVVILDTTTASLAGAGGSFSLDGPAHVYGDSVTVGADTFTTGYVVVDGGTANQVFQRLQPAQTELLPFAMVVFFVLGLLAGRFGFAQ